MIDHPSVRALFACCFQMASVEANTLGRSSFLHSYLETENGICNEPCFLQPKSNSWMKQPEDRLPFPSWCEMQSGTRCFRRRISRPLRLERDEHFRRRFGRILNQ